MKHIIFTAVLSALLFPVFVLAEGNGSDWVPARGFFARMREFNRNLEAETFKTITPPTVNIPPQYRYPHYFYRTPYSLSPYDKLYGSPCPPPLPQDRYRPPYGHSHSPSGFYEPITPYGKPYGHSSCPSGFYEPIRSDKPHR